MEHTSTNKHPLSLFKHCPRCGGHFAANDWKSMRCATCGFVYYANASAATVALVGDGRGGLLVTERAFEPAKGTLDLPGGFVDIGETAEEGVVREVFEETSLTVVEARYLFSLTNCYSYSGFVVRTLDLFFACRVDDLSPLSARDDASMSRFVKIDELEPGDFGLHSVREGIKMIKDGRVTFG